MGFLTLTLEDAARGLRQYAGHLKLNAATLRGHILAGTLTGQHVDNMLNGILRAHKATAAPFIAALGPRLAEHMKAGLVDDKQEVEADFQAMVAAADECDSYIAAVLEKNSGGKLGATFPESALPGLQTRIEALLATTG